MPPGLRPVASAFASLAALQVGALVQQADPFFTQRRDQLALLAARYAMPAIYEGRQFAEAGGLMSYGISVPAMYHQLGIYCGRILKGEKPSDLPVMQPTKFQLVVNLTAANVIGKGLTGRRRPYVEVPVRSRLRRVPRSTSFPSGHAANAAA